MDGSRCIPSLETGVQPVEVLPGEFPPIIRFLWSKDRVQIQSMPHIVGLPADELAAQLRAESERSVAIGARTEELTVKVECPEVISVDTSEKRLILDLRAGLRLTIPTITREGGVDARAIREGLICAGHLVEFYGRSNRAPAADAPARTSAPSVAHVSQRDLLERSLSRMAATQRVSIDSDDPWARA